jgi:hypothetical protein
MSWLRVNEVIHMVHGHPNLDVLDNCDLHPAQCLGCLFGQRRDFLGGNECFSISKFSFFFLFFRKFDKFSMPKHGKRNHDLDVECKSQGIFLQLDIYFSFISTKIGKKPFFPTSSFTFLVIVAWSISLVLLPHLEGRMDMLGFKSHRLPY